MLLIFLSVVIYPVLYICNCYFFRHHFFRKRSLRITWVETRVYNNLTLPVIFIEFIWYGLCTLNYLNSISVQSTARLKDFKKLPKHCFTWIPCGKPIHSRFVFVCISPPIFAMGSTARSSGLDSITDSGLSDMVSEPRRFKDGWHTIIPVRLGWSPWSF